MSSLSDPRILKVLHCGERFRRIIDPDGILSEGSIQQLFHTLPRSGNSFSWGMSFSFNSGDVLYVSGSYEEGFVINLCVLTSGNTSQKLKIIPSGTFLASLGELSSLPQVLKRNLSFQGHKNELSDATFDFDYFRLIEMIFLWGVELCKDNEYVRNNFYRVLYQFEYSQDGYPYKCSVTAKCKIDDDYQICISFPLDVYGLGRKDVLLKGKLSENNCISSSCFSESSGGRTVPSIDVALALYRRLSPSSHLKQKRKKQSLGKPRLK